MILVSTCYMLLGLILAFSLLFNNRQINGISLMLMVMFSLFFFSGRSNLIGSDTFSYFSYFETLQTTITLRDVFFNRFEPGFALFSYFSSIFLSFEGYKALIALIQITFIFFISNKFFGVKISLLYLYALLGFFVFINLNINIIRQGIAMPFFLLSVFYLAAGRVGLAVIFSLVAASFHFSAIISLSVIIFLVLAGRRFFVLSLILWGLILVLSYFSLIEPIMKHALTQLGLETHYQHILRDSSFEHYEVGFRLEFIFFSLIPLFIVTFNKFYGFKNIVVDKLFAIYFILNAVFILLIWMPFSDRIAIYSWILIPILFILFMMGYNKKSSASERIEIGMHVSILSKPRLYAINLFLIIVFTVTGSLSFMYYPAMRLV